MKKTLKLLISAMVLVLTGCIVLVIINQNMVKAEAGATLPGVESIINANISRNAYKIVEVVANKADARLGYLVAGEEPIRNGRALRDMPSTAERTDAMGSFSTAGITDLINAGAVIYTPGYTESADGTSSVEIKGYIISSAGGAYSLTNNASTYRLYDPSTDPVSAIKYSEYVDWFYGNEYAITFKEATSSADKQIVYNGNTYGIYDAYYLNGEVAVSSYTAQQLLEMEDRYVFVRDTVLGTYAYYGKVISVPAVDGDGNTILDGDGNVVYTGAVENTDGTVIDGTILGYDYVFINLELNNAAGSYVIGSYTPVTSGGYSLYKHFERDDENGIYVIDVDAHSTLNYVGDGNGNKAFVSDFTYDSLETVKYTGGLKSTEWLKAFTFDLASSSYNDFVIDVVTVTMDEFNALDVSKYDLVMLSGGSYSSDMSATQAQSLIKAAITDKMPVVLETGFDSNAAACPNNHKVATVLRQNSLSNSLVSNASSNWDNGNYWTAATGGIESKVKDVNASHFAYVNNSIFVYDDVDTGTDLISGGFVTAFSGDLTNWGFSAVKNELSNENFYRSRESLPTINDTICPATAIRYIINFSSQRVIIKSSINVLEIQPCYSFLDVYAVGTGASNDLKKVWEPSSKSTVTVNTLNHEILSQSYIANNWATQFKTDISKINLTQTYTREFIGKVEDLNENYDLIYIGLDTTTLNTRIDRYRDDWGYVTSVVKTTHTLYNDSAMNGLIYTHIGDYVSYRDNSDSEKNKLYWTGKFTTNEYRLSGNDITAEKLRDLKNYIDAGYPVIFHDNFFTYSGGKPTGVNSDVIDSSSNMYQLATYALTHINSNVFYDSQVTSSNASSDENAVKNRLSNHLNLSKLKVTMTVRPAEYVASNTSPVYLTKTDGDYYLIYEFALKNDAVVDTQGTKYDVKLYIDTSVDGRYSADEEIPSLSVYEQIGGGWYPINKNESNKYELVAGKNYRIKRIVPNGYVGVLPWKLVFSQNNNSQVRVSESGYTAVPVATSNREIINVLQIITNNTSSTYNKNYLDLTDANVKKQLDLVQDFDVRVTKITATEYLNYANPRNTTDSSGYLSYLNKYDMLVLGFSDCYEMYLSGQDNKNAAGALAIQQYVKSGRSILFTHDTTSFNNRRASSEWGYYFNQYVRGVVGMDRFNVLNKATAYDYAYNPKTARGSVNSLIQGYSDGTILGNNSKGSLYRSTCRYAQYEVRGGQYNSNANYVTKVNDGQITNYPFKIPDTFEVAKTHYQYYQLNLDTDSTDSNTDDDIVVWYCISDIAGSTYDDLYQATPNDVRNNYYIYNMGNVTYSGVGHRAVTTAGDDPTELRLFINTMVAAYKAGVHPPKVTYRGSEDSYAAAVDTTYMVYDAALNNGNGAYLTSSVDLYFEISDTSFIQGERTLKTQYYIETDSAHGTKTSINGQNVYLSRITPTIKKIEKKNGKYVEKDVSDILLLDTDTRYKMTITTDQLGNANKDSVKVYVAAETIYTQVGGEISSGVGYYPMNIVRIELFDLE